MFKTNNKSIVSGLSLLAILAFGITSLPTGASAQYFSGSSGYYGGTAYSDSQSNYQPNYQSQNYYQAPTYIAQPVAVAPTPTIYSNNTNPNANKVNTSTTTKTVAKANTSTAVAKTDNTSNLAAAAVLGTNGFMPSGLIQWIIFAILILLIIILVRKVSGADKKYQDTPMKHA